MDSSLYAYAWATIVGAVVAREGPDRAVKTADKLVQELEKRLAARCQAEEARYRNSAPAPGERTP